jgi:small GTP-binding protein
MVKDFRLVAIGSVFVGKTCLIKSLQEQPFDSNERPTQSPGFVSYHVDVDDSQAFLTIWDTAGEEQFGPIGPLYYRDTAAALVVFAVDDEKSYQDLPGWVQAFQQVAGSEAIVMIIANKMDLFPESPPVVTEAELWAQSNGYLFQTTSAKTGLRVQDMIRDVAAALLKQPIVEEEKPRLEPETSWHCC